MYTCLILRRKNNGGEANREWEKKKSPLSRVYTKWKKAERKKNRDPLPCRRHSHLNLETSSLCSRARKFSLFIPRVPFSRVYAHILININIYIYCSGICIPGVIPRYDNETNNWNCFLLRFGYDLQNAQNVSLYSIDARFFSLIRKFIS